MQDSQVFWQTPHRHPQTMSVRLLVFLWLGTQHTQAHPWPSRKPKKKQPNNTPPFPRTSQFSSQIGGTHRTSSAHPTQNPQRAPEPSVLLFGTMKTWVSESILWLMMVDDG